MKGIWIALILIGNLLIMTTEASAFCSEPLRPSGMAPSIPYCGSSGDLSGCSQSEVNDFKDRTEDYIKRLKRYVDEALEYANCYMGEAQDYSKRKAEGAVNDWNSFTGA